MAFFTYIGMLLVILYMLNLFYKEKKSKTPTNWPVIGMLPGVLGNIHRVHEFMNDLLLETGHTFEFKGPLFANLDILMTCDPANVHYILSKNFTNYPKGPDYQKIFEGLGDGIFNAEAESWKIQRETTMTVLNHRGFQKFVVTNTCNKVAKGLIPVLEHVSKLGIDVDFQDIIQRFTFDTTCIWVMGHDPASLSIDFPNTPYNQAFADAEEAALDRHVFPQIYWRLQRFLQIGKEKKLRRAEHIIGEFLDECIILKREKLKGGINQTSEYKEGYIDFLTGYMKALEEKVGTNEIPEKAWRDTPMNLIFAGKNPIGSSLTWLFWFLSTNPIEENKVREEIVANMHAKEDGTWDFSNVEDLKKLVYLHGALCETLRLYPPVGLQHKAPFQADILPSGHHIKADTKTVLSFYSMARMESIWGKDCLEFKPERWISEEGKIKHVPSFKFTAFNAGPRSCLGKDMSFTQLKIVAAAVIYHFQIKVIDGQQISPTNSIILHMQHGLNVRVIRIND